MVEINGWPEFVVWLEKHAPSVCTTIATRAALRTIAALGDPDLKTNESMTLVVFRAVLTAGSTVTSPATEANYLRKAARLTVGGNVSGKPPASWSGSSAHYAVRAAAGFNHVESVSRTARAAINAGGAEPGKQSASSAIMRDAARLDADASSKTLFRTAAWGDVEEPEELRERRIALTQFLDADPNKWDFWARWYRGMFEGRPMDWALQRAVALIDPEDWDKGPEHAARIIRRIETSFRTRVGPNIIRDEAAGQFVLELEETLPDDILGFVLPRIDSVLANALESGSDNGLRDDAYETVTIRRALDEHHDRASLLATGFYDACLSLQTRLDEGFYPRDPALLNLKNSLWAATEQICEVDEKARAQCARLASLQSPPPLSRQESAMAGDVVEQIGDELAADARAQLERDAALIEGLSKPPKSVRARFTNWVTTISLWIDRAKKGDARAQWLADKADRLVKWWSENG